MFDQERTADGRRVPIPFGKDDCTMFRKVMSTEDTIQEFAPALRTEAQGKAFRLALQVLGDLCGPGTNYFNLDNVGYVKTATEVSSDNSALMRNVRKNENALEGALAGVAHALLACARHMGVDLPEGGGDVSVIYDDSIVQDTAPREAAGHGRGGGRPDDARGVPQEVVRGRGIGSRSGRGTRRRVPSKPRDGAGGPWNALISRPLRTGRSVRCSSGSTARKSLTTTCARWFAPCGNLAPRPPCDTCIGR